MSVGNDTYISVFGMAETEREMELLARLDNAKNIGNNKYGLTIKNMKFGFCKSGYFSRGRKYEKRWDRVIAKLECEEQFNEKS